MIGLLLIIFYIMKRYSIHCRMIPSMQASNTSMSVVAVAYSLTLSSLFKRSVITVVWRLCMEHYRIVLMYGLIAFPHKIYNILCFYWNHRCSVENLLYSFIKSYLSLWSCSLGSVNCFDFSRFQLNRFGVWFSGFISFDVVLDRCDANGSEICVPMPSISHLLARIASMLFASSSSHLNVGIWLVDSHRCV